MSIITRIIICVMVLLSDALSIILECRLPNERKSIKWNFDTRGLFYKISSFIHFFLAILIIAFIEPDEMVSDSNLYFFIISFFGILIFFSVFILDKINIKKRFKPYQDKNKEEFLKYKNNTYYMNVEWNTFDYALTKMATTLILISVIL